MTQLIVINFRGGVGQPEVAAVAAGWMSVVAGSGGSRWGRPDVGGRRWWQLDGGINFY